MQKVIPQQTIIICDVCEKECDINSRIKEGELIVKQIGLDWYNQPCGDASVSFHLCDTCLGHLVKTLNEEIDHIRNITNEAKSV